MKDPQSSALEVKVTVAALPDSDRRNKRRARMAQPVRVRPSEPRDNDFDEVLATINVCRNGVYFPTDRTTYYKEMRLFITFPYNTGHGAINQEYIGRVVRIDTLPGGRLGIAVHLVMTLNIGAQETIQR